MRLLGAAALWALVTACALDPAPSAMEAGGPAFDDLPPAGYGSLRQEELSVEMRGEGLQIRITPLDEAVIRLAAPDTYARLADLRGPEAAGADETVLLVSARALRDGVAFDPHGLRFERLGRLLRPRSIGSLRRSAAAERLGAGDEAIAIVRLPGRFQADDTLRIEYGAAWVEGWRQHLQRFQDERRRVEMRAAEAPSRR